MAEAGLTTKCAAKLFCLPDSRGMCIHSGMLRCLTRGLLVLLWIAAGVVPSVSANALSDKIVGSGMHSGAHNAHMHHSGASEQAYPSLKGGCDAGKAAKEGATCCPSMCQTADLVIPTISFKPVATGTPFLAVRPDDRTSIAPPLAERPPQTS